MYRPQGARLQGYIHARRGGGLMLQGYTMAIVPCSNPTPKKLPTRGGEWPTFRTARAQRVHSARYAPPGRPWWDTKKEPSFLTDSPGGRQCSSGGGGAFRLTVAWRPPNRPTKGRTWFIGLCSPTQHNFWLRCLQRSQGVTCGCDRRHADDLFPLPSNGGQGVKTASGVKGYGVTKAGGGRVVHPASSSISSV